MADPSASPHFQARFESALQAYQTKTGITLAEHALAVQLQSCHSVDSITTFLKYEAEAVSDFLGSDRTMESIESTVSILSTLSATASLGEAIGLVRRGIDRLFYIPDKFLQPFPPAKAILAGLAILFDVCAVI